MTTTIDITEKQQAAAIRQRMGYYWDDANGTHTPEGHVVTSDYLFRGHPGRECNRRKIGFVLNWQDAPAYHAGAEVVIDADDFTYTINPLFYCAMTPEQMQGYIECLQSLDRWAKREVAYMATVAPKPEVEEPGVEQPKVSVLRKVGRAMLASDPETCLRLKRDGTVTGSLISLGAYCYENDSEQFDRFADDED